ncbi:MAG: sporulation protein [Nocardiopsaceae bacterium]|nr:sporulation protein [Nocardiopsaceae bacterium]
MAFKRILAGLGFGGATVETVLAEENMFPGGVVRGHVHIEGGSVDQHVQRLTVGMQVRAEVERGDSEYQQDLEFARIQVGGELHLRPGARLSVPFELKVPWEAPISMYRGRYLRGMRVGVNTRLHVAAGVDPGDLDPVAVHALDTQTAIMDALDKLGFSFVKADAERGRIRGVRQRLPFYQEIEYRSPRRYRGLNELELTFITDERGCDVLLEMDKKPGLLLGEGRDTYQRFRVEHGTAKTEDWAGRLHTWIDSAAGRRGLL